MDADNFPHVGIGRADAYPCKEETHAIIGCAFEVLNELGHGLNEKLYENSLVAEFKRQSIAFDQQRRFEVRYKGDFVGEYIPDLIASGKAVVDVKTIDRITDHERGQMLNYLRITKLPVGLVLNFKQAKLDFLKESFFLTEGKRKTDINRR